jgi:hypothetical protein
MILATHHDRDNRNLMINHNTLFTGGIKQTIRNA